MDMLVLRKMEFGPRVYLTGVPSELELEASAPMTEQVCIGESCSRCLAVCPVGNDYASRGFAENHSRDETALSVQMPEVRQQTYVARLPLPRGAAPTERPPLPMSI